MHRAALLHHRQGVWALIGSLKLPTAGWWKSFAWLAVLFAGFGAFTAARQSWLQWYPPEFATCGRDFYGMIEAYPISRSLPMIFKGSGDCAAIGLDLPGRLHRQLVLCRFCGLCRGAAPGHLQGQALSDPSRIPGAARIDRKLPY